MSINYSIIIPHKNRPAEVARCLESIPQRDDLEIIIVDDNSDETLVDFDSFPNTARQDVRVVRILDSKGAGKARNVGIEQAKGNWLIFCDCDDSFSEVFNNILDKHIERLEDIVFYAVRCVDENAKEVADNYHFGYYKKNIEYAQKNEDFDTLRYSMNPPWGKIMRRSFILENNIRFDETPVANDLMFSIRSGYYAKSVSCSADVLYNWTVSSNSLTTQKSVEKIDCHLRVNIDKNNFLKEIGRYQYRSNLFKILKKYSGLGVKPIIRAAVLIIRNTPTKYIFKDFFSAAFAAIK